MLRVAIWFDINPQVPRKDEEDPHVSIFFLSRITGSAAKIQTTKVARIIMGLNGAVKKRAIEIGRRCHIPDTVMTAHVKRLDCRKMLYPRRCCSTFLTSGSYNSVGDGIGGVDFLARVLGIALTGIYRAEVEAEAMSVVTGTTNASVTLMLT